MLIFDRKLCGWIHMSATEYNQMIDEFNLLQELVWHQFVSTLYDKEHEHLSKKQIARIKDRCDIISMRLVFKESDLFM